MALAGRLRVATQICLVVRNPPERACAPWDSCPPWIWVVVCSPILQMVAKVVSGCHGAR